MPKFAPACISGLGKEWWNNASLREKFDVDKSLVKKFTPQAPMATKDRWHCINNIDLIAPVIAMQKAAHIIKTPSIKSLEEEVKVFVALRETNGNLDENNWPKIGVYETNIHLDASSIKKLLCCARHHYKRPHVPRDRFAKHQSFQRVVETTL